MARSRTHNSKTRSFHAWGYVENAFMTVGSSDPVSTPKVDEYDLAAPRFAVPTALADASPLKGSSNLPPLASAPIVVTTEN